MFLFSFLKEGVRHPYFTHLLRISPVQHSDRPQICPKSVSGPKLEGKEAFINIAFVCLLDQLEATELGQCTERVYLDANKVSQVQRFAKIK